MSGCLALPEAFQRQWPKPVPVRVLPSKRRKRLAALAAINRAMSAKLRERKEAAAKGLEELP
jgi:hypothetical protein